MRCCPLGDKLGGTKAPEPSPERLILPLFVTTGTGRRIQSEAIEGVKTLSVDLLVEAVDKAISAGVMSFLLFGHYEEDAKDSSGTPASDPGGPVQEALRRLTSQFDKAVLYTHISLSHATDHGLNFCPGPSGAPDMEKTRKRFLAIAESHLKAGAHGVIPLFLEKGFVRLLRSTMDTRGFSDRTILSYGAKFDSALYGPFNTSTSVSEKGMPREQIDPSDGKAASSKAVADIEEGASELIIKPALPYLDIIAKFRRDFAIPLVGWLVSGEYMMIKAAAAHNVFDEKRTVLEFHQCLFRAGVDRIITYDAIRLARWLRGKE